MTTYALCKLNSQKVIYTFNNRTALLVYANNYTDIDPDNYIVISYHTLNNGLKGVKYIELNCDCYGFDFGKSHLITEMKTDDAIRDIYAILVKLLAVEFRKKLIDWSDYLTKPVSPLVTLYTGEQHEPSSLNLIWGNGDWQKLVNSIYFEESTGFLPFISRKAFNNVIYVEIKKSLSRFEHKDFALMRAGSFITASPEIDDAINSTLFYDITAQINNAVYDEI